MNFGTMDRSRSGFGAQSTSPQTAGKRRRRPAFECLESRELLSGIVEYPVPSPGCLPTQITLGPDGNLWFTEGLGNELGIINPETHVVSDVTLPGNYILANGITTGPDGNLWFTDMISSDGVWSGAIGTINPVTHAITEFLDPVAGAVPTGITSGPDGNLWFTDWGSNRIGIINPTTGAITQFTIPGASSGPAGITTGPDGNIWVALGFTNSIAMINPTTRAVTEFALPAPAAGPAQIAVGPDGNLWCSEIFASQIVMINPTTHVITEIPTPAPVGGITAGPGGDIWLSMVNPAAIGMMNPSTFAMTTFPVNHPANGTGALPQGITAGPDGNVWFADTNGYGIGVLDPPVSPVTLGDPFGFTLSVKPSPAVAAADSGGSVTFALADAPGGDTLTVSTGLGVSTYSGLTLKKHGGSYRLVTNSVGLARATVRQASVMKAQPMLIETVLTAGTGKTKHVIGVEIAFNRSLDRTLAKVIAARTTHSVGQPVNLRVNSRYSSASTLANLAGHARLAPGGLIVVFAKA